LSSKVVVGMYDVFDEHFFLKEKKNNNKEACHTKEMNLKKKIKIKKKTR
jgi:hypothetical protein